MEFEMFTKDDVRDLFKNRFVLFLGDSIIRDVYKDFVWLREKGNLIPHEKLREVDRENKTAQGSLVTSERLMEGTGLLKEDLAKGREYREEREYRGSDDHPTLARFYFLTQCWSDHLKKFLLRVKKDDGDPNLIMILSCLWDINRWGYDGIDNYDRNCCKFLEFVRETFPSEKTKVIWLTSPPVAVEVWGGYNVQEIDFLRKSTRFNVVEANKMVAETTRLYGYNVVDLHYFLQSCVHRRIDDGIHWTPRANRFILNLVLTHYRKSIDTSPEESSNS